MDNLFDLQNNNHYFTRKYLLIFIFSFIWSDTACQINSNNLFVEKSKGSSNQKVSPTFMQQANMSDPHNKVLTIEKNSFSKVNSYNFLLDFEGMSPDVKQKISDNKVRNLPLSNGIIKRYNIRIPRVQKFSDLHDLEEVVPPNNGILQIQYIQLSEISILVRPDFSSTELKEYLSLLNIAADFLSEKYELLLP